MILNLINTMLVTLGTGTSVLNMPKKQINKPTNKAIEQFRLNISKSNLIESDTEGPTNWHQHNVEYKLTANNTGMMIKGNEIANNIYYHYEDSTQWRTTLQVENETPVYDLYTPKLAKIYQITTYENTKEVEQNYRIYTLVGLNKEIDPQNSVKNFKVKTITYQTQEDWSSYIDRNDYGSFNYIKTLQQEIESPQNGYRYSKTENLTTLTSGQNQAESSAQIETDIQLTKGTTTYIIQISQIIAEPVEGFTSEFGTIQIINPIYPRAYYFIYNIADNAYTYSYITGTLIIAEGTTEIVDIPGLIFQVLTMPFTFISAAFNLTLFPGTPYQINISNLFMAIIAVMAFIFILKLLIGLKGGN